MTGADEIVIDEHVQVRRFVLNDLLTNGFVVQAMDTGSLVVIDPGDRGSDLIAAAEAWGGDVRWILVTHLHGDHWAALAEVVKALGAPVVGPPGAPFHV
ncbi:MAG: MBL fold metallo-hydrolase, partial [Gemmatimonadetes bacterium]|nr:MBL fold metallo-hydrolase [Gemmatimonadota bacterium]